MSGNVLVLNMSDNLIIEGRQHVTNDEVVDMKRRYTAYSQFKVIQVCDVIFAKWQTLDAKYDDRKWPVTIKQLMRASEAFRNAVTRISPKKHRWHVQKAY
ncbi:hypothetical protein [Pseudomonas putida]|uniref:hypothetical protein n=1 Tax=Pseudomonas putida TaxID=303 RepID=UPI0018D7C14F|nr:hypothetical protein [Pseudomonas putida]MBH3346980.1 hypothetical protein [Pseudomonas putida]